LPLRKAIEKAGPRPPLTASRADKKRYAELVSGQLALAVAHELRARGLKETAPGRPKDGKKGGEKRISGGLGDKKVDVTYSTERSGLVLAVSIKTISFADQKTGNYQKNLQNRKGDLIFEVTTLHKRFPYAVVGGLLFLYEDAMRDSKGRSRVSTFERAHQLMRIFNRRSGPRNEESRFEFLAIGLYRDRPLRFSLSEAGNPRKKITFQVFLDELLRLVADRNPEEFVFHKGRLWKPSELGLPAAAEDEEA
jgi:hypothetical protein